MKSKFVIPILGLIFTFACGDDDEGATVPSATFTVSIENVFEVKDYSTSGVFNTPTGASEAGPAVPGDSYSFSFYAGAGDHLSFATMFVQSNDLFYAPGQNGIPLYDNGNPVSGDITSQVDLWDAGTETNEEPYSGENQAPRQSGANTGGDENGTVSLVADVNDGFSYPSDEEIVRVSIQPGGDSRFTVTIENISSGNFATPIAPGVFVIHPADASPLFIKDQPNMGNGLEALAEDGGASGLGDYLAENSGFSSPFAPGVFAVHDEGIAALFDAGSPDPGEGLEALAEDGDPSGLAGSLASKTGVLSSDAFNTPSGASGAGPLLPGNSYEFTFDAEEGSYLNFATMLVQSNDLFYAFSENGIALFQGGNPISGDMTSQVTLWDAGTEVNEFPGTGPNQPLRQSGADTGSEESGNVMMVNDGFTYPANATAIKVTITSQ